MTEDRFVLTPKGKAYVDTLKRLLARGWAFPEAERMAWQIADRAGTP